jgi:CRP-like cAMP-binding protein
MPHVYMPPDVNSLLAALPRNGAPLLFDRMQPVALVFGDVLYYPGKPIHHVYFPTNSLISLLNLTEGHQALEVGMVGHEGMLGIPLALGVNDSPVYAQVQGAGMAWRMTSAHFHDEFLKNALLQRKVYRYIHELMVQLAQTAVCNRFHHIEARLARWLLMTRDRVRSNHLHLTHDLLAHTLGVRRVGVTQAAGALRLKKLISYSRGEINILDEIGLEAAACPCYQQQRHDAAPG